MSQLSRLEEKQVRRAWNAETQKWQFAILTGSVDAGAYWRKLKERQGEVPKKLAFSERWPI